jgi:hypothetical protein
LAHSSTEDYKSSGKSSRCAEGAKAIQTSPELRFPLRTLVPGRNALRASLWKSPWLRSGAAAAPVRRLLVNEPVPALM